MEMRLDLCSFWKLSRSMAKNCPTQYCTVQESHCCRWCVQESHCCRLQVVLWIARRTEGSLLGVRKMSSQDRNGAFNMFELASY